jgi:hypothetical protein
VLSAISFIGTTNGSVVICFPRKKISFYFNRSCDPDTESRSQKVKSLKDFKVHGVPKIEPPHNGQKAINPFGTVICPK